MRMRVSSIGLAAVALLIFSATTFAATPPAGVVNPVWSYGQTAPPVAAGTFAPRVMAVDAPSAGLGTQITPFIADLDAWLATSFGWRSAQEVTVVITANDIDMLSVVGSLRGSPVMASERGMILSRPAFLMQAQQGGIGMVTTMAGTTSALPTSGWVIVLNLDTTATRNDLIFLTSGMNPAKNWKPSSAVTTQDTWSFIYESTARQYILMMEQQVGGTAVPSWLREGMADALAFRFVPGTPMEFARPRVASSYRTMATPLPSLAALSNEMTWNQWMGSYYDVGRAVAAVASSTLLDRVGPSGVVKILTSLKGGQGLEAAMMGAGAPSLADLTVAYQARIP